MQIGTTLPTHVGMRYRAALRPEKKLIQGFIGAAKVSLFSIFPNQKQPLSSPLNETNH